MTAESQLRAELAAFPSADPIHRIFELLDQGGDPTFTTLHVTGASTLDGSTFLEPPAAAGIDGVRGATLIHDAHPGIVANSNVFGDTDLSRYEFVQDIWGDLLLVNIYTSTDPNGVGAYGVPVAAAPQFYIMAPSDAPASSSNPRGNFAFLGFGAFELGHFGDTSHENQNNYGYFRYTAVTASATLDLVLTGTSQAQLHLDSATGFAGAGVAAPTTTWDVDGTFHVSGTTKLDGNIGFYSHAPAAKPTVTGSRGANAAVASLLTALAGLGLLTDSSS